MSCPRLTDKCWIYLLTFTRQCKPLFNLTKTGQKQRKVNYLQKFELSWVCEGWKHLLILFYGQLKHKDVMIRDPRVKKNKKLLKTVSWVTFAFSSSTIKWQSEALKKYSLALYFNSGLSMVFIATWKTEIWCAIWNSYTLSTIFITLFGLLFNYIETSKNLFQKHAFKYCCMTKWPEYTIYKKRYHLSFLQRSRKWKYLFIDFNRLLILLQLSAVMSNLQEAFVGWAETQTNSQVNRFNLSL